MGPRRKQLGGGRARLPASLLPPTNPSTAAAARQALQAVQSLSSSPSKRRRTDDDDDGMPHYAGGFDDDDDEDPTPSVLDADAADIDNRLYSVEPLEEDVTVLLSELGFSDLNELRNMREWQDRADMHEDPEDEPTAAPDEGDDESDTLDSGTVQGQTTVSTAGDAASTSATVSTATATAAASGSMLPPATPGAPEDPGWPDESQLIQHNRGQIIPDVSMALGLWCQRAGVSRRDFATLRNIFDMASAPAHQGEVGMLPRTLDTLKRHYKGGLPLLTMRMKNIPLNPAKQPTGKSANEDLYFFDPKALFQAYLSTDGIRDKMFQGLGHYVDAPAQLWESNAWLSSIRISSGEFITYTDGTAAPAVGEPVPVSAVTGKSAHTYVMQTKGQFRGYIGGPILPSDFVRFQCSDQNCHRCNNNNPSTWHIGRVLSTGHDRRNVRRHGGPTDSLVVKVQRIIQGGDLPVPPAQLSPAPHPKELFLVEGQDAILLPHQVRPLSFDVVMHYGFQSAHKHTDLPDGQANQYMFFIRRIWKVTAGASINIRPLWQHHPVRGELEILHFSRAALVKRFFQGDVVSLPLIIFLDGFGLYRNMYRSLMGYYAINGAFSIQDRAKRTNVIPLTLGPHGSNISAVIDAIGPALRELDSGVQMIIKGKLTTVCAMTFFFIGDMPQQAENSGMLSQKATYGCRFCNIHKDEFSDMSKDLVPLGRYHHETMRKRDHLEHLIKSGTRGRPKFFEGSRSRSQR